MQWIQTRLHGLRLRRRFAEWYDGDAPPPWDSGVVPPEVVVLIETLPAGRVLDIGCGTGTTSVYLASHGWEVTGLDYIENALTVARNKAAQADMSERAIFVQGDITRLPTLDLNPPYDLAVDIGCSHGLAAAQRAGYVSALAGLMRPGATLASYMHYPREGGMSGLTPDEVKPLYNTHFEIVDVTVSEDTANGRPSAWYVMRRR